VFIKLFL